MKRDVTIPVEMEEHDDFSSLTPEEKSLLEKAMRSAETAYAPYSSFHVGAAIKLDNGEVVTGSNQENAAYPSGLCAERVAIYSAGANFPENAPLILAIRAFSKQYDMDQPVAPCGACRQAIAEYERRSGKAIRILMMGQTGGIRAVNGIENLLPMLFHETRLKKQ